MVTTNIDMIKEYTVKKFDCFEDRVSDLVDLSNCKHTVRPHLRTIPGPERDPVPHIIIYLHSD